MKDPFLVIRLFGAFGGLFGGALVGALVGFILGFYFPRIGKTLFELLSSL